MVERKKGFQIAANIIMILLAALCIIPFVLLVMSSVTDESALLKNGYSFFLLSLVLMHTRHYWWIREVLSGDISFLFLLRLSEQLQI